MAQIQTPTGETIFVPDDWSNFVPPPPMASIPEYATGPTGTPAPAPPPPPPPPPPPQTIGPGMPQVEETAGPVPGAPAPASVMDQLAMPPPGPAPLQEIPVPLANAGELAKRSAANAKAEKQAQAQAAQQAAFAGTSEGKIQAAGEQQAQAVEGQRGTAQQQSDLESAQLGNIAAIKAQGVIDANAERQRADAERAQRAQGLADKRVAIDKLTKAETDYKIDDNRRWNNLSTGRKILAGISVALSGLGDALMKRSGPNAALGIIQDAIRDDVGAQVRERDQLGKRIGMARNSLDDYQRETGTMLDAHKLKLAEEHDRVAEQVDATAAMYGSPAAKLRGQMISDELRKTAAGIRASTAENVFNRDEKRKEDARQQQSIGIAGANAATAAKGQTLSERRFEWDKQRAADEDKAKILAASLKGDPEQAKLVRERAMGGEPELIKDKDGKVTGVKFGLIKQANGDVWVPGGTETNVTELQKRHDATVQLVQIIDQIKREGPGWLSDINNSDKKQRLDQLMGDARLIAIQAKGLGVPTGHDIELVENFLGTSDPTRRKDSLAGLSQSRDSLVRDHNVELRRSGLDRDWKPADLGSIQESTPTGQDKNWQDTLSGKADHATKIQTLQTVGALAQSTDPGVRDANIKLLETAAASAPDADVKATAQQYLKAFRPATGPGPQIAQPVQPESPATGDVTPTAGGAQYAAAGGPKLPPAILNYDPYKQLATVRLANGTTMQMSLSDAYKVAPPDRFPAQPGLTK